MERKNSQRLQILSEHEIAALYSIPDFNHVERNHYFELPKPLLDLLAIGTTNGRHTSAKLYFILQYGYFKARYQFFNINYDIVKSDAHFIMQQYMSNDIVPHQLPTRKTQLLARKQILQHLGFRDDRKMTDQLITKKACSLAMIMYNPVEMFNEIIQSLQSLKIVIPPYSRLQDLIGSAIWNERRRVIGMIREHLPEEVKNALESMLRLENSLYSITEIKLDAKSFQASEMQAEIKKLALCQPIYLFAVNFIPKLSLSRRMIDHYADLAKLYIAPKLGQLPRELAFLYMICYIHKRYEKLTNNLIQAFIYHVDKYHNEAKKYAKDKIAMLEDPLERYRAPVGKLMRIFTNRKIMSLSGNRIKKHALKVMTEERIIDVSNRLLDGEKNRKKEEQRLIWEYHKDHFQVILINLRPLFMAIDFEGSDGLENLFNAIQFLKTLFQKGDTPKDIPLKQVPTAHIRPVSLFECFTENTDSNVKKIRKMKSVNPWKYEFHVYRCIRENIKSKRMHVNASSDYKSFDSEIKIPDDWVKNEKKILADLNNLILLRPIDETLTELENILEPLIARVNRRALNGENLNIKIKHRRDGNCEWTIPYPKRKIEVDNPFYDHIEIKTISEVFDFVEQQCRFMKSFVHIKPHKGKAKPDYPAIKAAILANGTMQGIHLFSKRSNLNYHRLQKSENSHIRLITLRNSSNIIISNIVNLSIFSLYDLDGKKHGSSDGTKKKTRKRLLKARHSSKYFGSDIGVVIMNMLLGHVPFETEIIGANEHESHYIFPLMYRNESAIDPDIISTDTAGANNVNDFFYYLVGKLHAPCYRSIPRKAKTLCGFKPLSQYSGLLIQPSDSVNIKLIKTQWPTLLPILASMLRYDVTQENIIKTLSAHEYKSDTKDAMWEINRILKSIHILKYIDDPDYRRNIRTALNRGEAYHQLLEKIRAVGGGDFRGMSEIEVEIWNECTRFIALVIIYYNMHLLSRLYEMALAKNDQAAIKYLRHISPVASQNTNINGLYEFSEAIANVNVDGIVAFMSKALENAIKPQSIEEVPQYV